jgi:large subunit ribosomal protein L16
MLLRPRQTKFTKYMRSKLRKSNNRYRNLQFGRFGLVAKESGFISARSLEACRMTLNRHLKRKGKIWICVFPDFPMSAKPIESRMGKGKGNIDAWYVRVNPGKVLFEVDGLQGLSIRSALLAAKNKLPLSTNLRYYPFK